MPNAEVRDRNKPGYKHLRKGQGVRGPEPCLGCYNTGLAPVILRSRVTGEYLVGPELAVDTARNAILFFGNGLTRKRSWLTGKGERSRVWKFRTASAAWKKFDALVATITANRERERAEVAKARATIDACPIGEKALEAAFVLADHGVI